MLETAIQKLSYISAAMRICHSGQGWARIQTQGLKIEMNDSADIAIHDVGSWTILSRMTGRK